MVDLLENFLNPLKLFMAMVSDFMTSLWRRLGGGIEKMMCGGPDTANQVRDRKKRAETKVFANGEQIKKYLIIPSLRPA
jgi:hypothetical protein